MFFAYSRSHGPGVTPFWRGSDSFIQVHRFIDNICVRGVTKEFAFLDKLGCQPRGFWRGTSQYLFERGRHISDSDTKRPAPGQPEIDR